MLDVLSGFLAAKMLAWTKAVVVFSRICLTKRLRTTLHMQFAYYLQRPFHPWARAFFGC